MNYSEAIEKFINDNWGLKKLGDIYERRINIYDDDEKALKELYDYMVENGYDVEEV